MASGCMMVMLQASTSPSEDILVTSLGSLLWWSPG